MVLIGLMGLGIAGALAVEAALEWREVRVQRRRIEERLRYIVAVLAIALSASAAHAAGGTWTVNGESATTYTGGCTAVGVRWGRTLPQCDNATDGTFIIHTWLPDFCALPEVTVEAAIFENLSGIAGTANNCFTTKFASETNDADANDADITWGTATSQVAYNIDSCDTNDTTSICVTGASNEQAPKNLGTGAACATTACNNRSLKMQILQDAGAGCTTPSTDAVDYIGFVLSCD